MTTNQKKEDALRPLQFVVRIDVRVRVRRALLRTRRERRFAGERRPHTRAVLRGTGAAAATGTAAAL